MPRPAAHLSDANARINTSSGTNPWFAGVQCAAVTRGRHARKNDGVTHLTLARAVIRTRNRCSRPPYLRIPSFCDTLEVA